MILHAESIDVMQAESLEIKLEGEKKKLEQLCQKIWDAEKNLGATGLANVHHLLKNTYITKRMNAWALKIHICHKLCQYKFEFNWFERVARRQRNGISTSLSKQLDG